MLSIYGIWIMKLVSADPQKAMKSIRDAGITLMEVEQTDLLTWQFKVQVHDGKKIIRMATKSGYDCQIIEKYGFNPIVSSAKRRPVLIIGLMLLLFFSVWLPSRVLFIEIQGNETLSAQSIMEEAKDCGIIMGASRRFVRSQQVKNTLLDKLPQLQWAGVETIGCVAVITVRERQPVQSKPISDGICSIVANRDGIIHSITVLKGNALCKPGQAVKTGQVLISAYTDCGICIRADRANGEVLGLTQHKISTIFPREWMSRGDYDKKETKFSLIIGKKQINFYKDSGILGMSCAKIYEQKYMTLPGGFQLPICLLIEQRLYYENTSYLDMDGTVCMQDFSKRYVLSQTQGGKIEYMQELFREANGCLILDGTYGCVENIGKVQMEEEIPYYGKND